MVNVFGESVGSGGSVELQLVKKVLQQWARLGTTLMKYDKAISSGLHLTDYTRRVMAHLLLPFVFMMGAYMYRTMKPRCRLSIDVLQQIK